MQDPHEFAVTLVRSNHAWAVPAVAQAYAELTEPLTGPRLVYWIRSFMWREYALGVHPPAKMITLLPDDCQDLKLLLSSQMADEWKHAQIFSDRVSALGGDGDLAGYRPTEADLEAYRATMDFEHPEELAASLNVTGEVWLQCLYKRLADPRSPRLDPDTARAVRDEILAESGYAEGCILDDRTALRLREEVIPDEGRHIRIGRMVIERMATTPEAQERVRAAVARKREGLMTSHQGVANATVAI
jgi:hypothetical protein